MSCLNQMAFGKALKREGCCIFRPHTGSNPGRHYLSNIGGNLEAGTAESSGQKHSLHSTISL